MKKKTKHAKSNGLRAEYDLSKVKGAARGKYLARYKAGTNLILLSPDVVKFFPDEKSVNAALRSLIRSKRQRRS